MDSSIRMILQAVEALVKPVESNESKDKPKEFNFDALLSQNIDALQHYAESINYDRLKRCFEKQETQIGTRWKFVEISLNLMDCLNETMTQALQLYKETDQKSNKNKPLSESRAPPMSPDVLSFSQQKHVTTLLQFIVCLGVCPNLQPGVGIPIAKRSGFAQLIKGNDQDIAAELREWRLLRCVSTMLHCVQQPSLGSLILSAHLGDIIACLAQLSCGPCSRLKTEAKPRSTLHSSEIATLPVISSDASPADVVDTVLKQNKGISGNTIDLDKTTKEATDEQTKSHVTMEVKCETKQDEIKLSLNSNPQTDGTVSIEDRQWCKDELQQLLDRVYPPLVVRELLILQTGIPGFPKVPMWLRKFCSHVLSEKLMRPRGVQYVLRGMLEGTTGSSNASDWKKCDAAAKVVANCPKSVKSAEEYYSKIAPQIIDLLHIEDKNLARQFLRVATSTISAMVTNCPGETKTYLIDPLLQPLITCLQTNDLANVKEEAIIAENEMLRCIADVHKVFVSSELQNSLLKYLEPVLPVLFELYYFTNNSVYKLRSLCEEILIRYLRHGEMNHVVHSICALAFNLTSELKSGGMNPQLYFTAGPTGGVQVVKSHGDNEVSFVVKMNCIVRLLKGVNSDDVTANFFLRLLQDLSEVINSETREPSSDDSGGSHTQETLYHIEQRVNTEVEKITHSLIVVQLLAEMSEHVGPSCFKNTTHILQFAKVTLERGVHVLQHTEDEGFGLLESETVSMAMGLLTAVMSGASKVSIEDRQRLNDLLPLLDTMSRQHPDDSVREMATDLRIAIATHGHVLSDALRDASQQKSKKKRQDQPSEEIKLEAKVPEKNKVKTDVKIKPLIEVLSSHEESVLSHEDAKDTKPVIKAEKCEPKVTSDRKTISVVKGETSESQNLHKNSASKASDEKSQLDVAFEELMDPLIPVRGHALITLRRLLEAKDAEALEKQQLLLKVFQENLDHADSYIYLAAIQGMSVLADRMPDEVLPCLVEQYSRPPDKPSSAELRIKVGEVLVKTCRNMGDMMPKYRDMLLNSLLTGAKDSDPLVRASAVSNLGDVCKSLHFSLGSCIHEIFTCVSSLIKTDSDSEVRKASAMFATMLLQGLGQDTIKVLDSVLLDLYRVLKHTVRVELNETVLLHARLALDELDQIMRQYLFPQQTLTKQIHVLDPPT